MRNLGLEEECLSFFVDKMKGERNGSMLFMWIKITKLNQSEEYILLNSIRGKLKSRKLLCESCNSNFRDKIDDELSSQLNFISNMLDLDYQSIWK